MVYLPARAPGQVRIGVSIAIPAPFDAQLQAARQTYGDPLAHAIGPHVTIVGPTVVDEADLPAVEAHLEQVAAAASSFTMKLRGTGTFRPVSPVTFVTVAQGIAECERLEVAARTGVLAQPLRFPYHPHVTIAHEVNDGALDAAFDALADFRADFAVTKVWQHLHGDDGVWRPVRAYALGS